MRVLGVGGFGVTYLADDVRLGRSVAIKEYLPNEFAVRAGETVHPKSRSDEEDFAWGLKRFLEEARTLARFRHPNLVRVLDYFEVNHTAYIVMDYEEGEALDRVLERRGTLSEAQLKRVLLPIVDGLKEVHAAGYLHRDIKPSNVFIRRSDESPVLLDFGSARQALGRKSKSLTAVASAGYSPPEQYESEGEQGPWTDIYALSALCYRAITGTAPIEAPRRMSQLIQRRPDPLSKLANEQAPGYPKVFLAAVDQGLELAPADRPSRLDGWIERFSAARPAAPQPREQLDAGSDAEIGREVEDGGAQVALQETRLDVRGTLAALPRRAWLVAGAGMAAVACVWLILDASYGTLTLDLTPPDAAVTLGDSGLLYQPGIRIRNGVHRVRAKRAGYHEVTLNVLVSDDTRGEIQLSRIQPEGQPKIDGRTGEERPRPDPGTPQGRLTLDLAPTDATVTLGGGQPYTPGIQLPNGRHEVTVRRPGYRGARRSVAVFGDTRARIALEPMESRGTLTLDLSPADATVTLGGGRSYSPGIQLPNGRWEVTVTRPGYREAVRTVEVSGGTRLRIALEPLETPGTLTLDLFPPDATVMLDDSSLSYGPGMRLPNGTHEVTVSRAGYHETTRTVEVSGNTRLRIALDVVTLMGPAGMEFVWVPPGEFRMGSTSPEASRNEQPVTQVRISEGFWLGRYEVTQAEWKAVMGSSPSRFENCGISCPVTNVSWNEAKLYIARLNAQEGRRMYRLPTESEWEYAARAGTTGDRYGDLNTIAWYRDNSLNRTRRIGQKTPNDWGLYDMLGNVEEFVEDIYEWRYPGGTVTDPRGPRSGQARVVRGCGWIDSARICRMSNRGRIASDSSNSARGFRLVRVR